MEYRVNVVSLVHAIPGKLSEAQQHEIELRNKLFALHKGNDYHIPSRKAVDVLCEYGWFLTAEDTKFNKLLEFFKQDEESLVKLVNLLPEDRRDFFIREHLQNDPRVQLFIAKAGWMEPYEIAPDLSKLSAEHLQEWYERYIVDEINACIKKCKEGFGAGSIHKDVETDIADIFIRIIEALHPTPHFLQKTLLSLTRGESAPWHYACLDTDVHQALAKHVNFETRLRMNLVAAIGQRGQYYSEYRQSHLSDDTDKKGKPIPLKPVCAWENLARLLGTVHAHHTFGAIGLPLTRKQIPIAERFLAEHTEEEFLRWSYYDKEVAIQTYLQDQEYYQKNPPASRS